MSVRQMRKLLYLVQQFSQLEDGNAKDNVLREYLKMFLSLIRKLYLNLILQVSEASL